MKTSRAIALAAAALILGIIAARWYSARSPRLGAGSGNDMMAELMKDPQVTEITQNMQAQSLRKRYAALVKQLNLAPEQSDAFYDLLINHKKEQETLGFQLLSGTNNPATARITTATQKILADQLRSLLGENGYAQYEDYNAGMRDRSALQRMHKDFADNPLSDVQQQRLLQLIKAQEKTIPGPNVPDFKGKSSSRKNMVALMTLVIQQQEDIDHRVLQGAGDFLSPAQIQMLATSQSNQLSMQKMTLSITQKMFNRSMSNPAPATQ